MVHPVTQPIHLTTNASAHTLTTSQWPTERADEANTNDAGTLDWLLWQTPTAWISEAVFAWKQMPWKLTSNAVSARLKTSNAGVSARRKTSNASADISALSRKSTP